MDFIIKILPSENGIIGTVNGQFYLYNEEVGTDSGLYDIYILKDEWCECISGEEHEIIRNNNNEIPRGYFIYLTTDINLLNVELEQCIYYSISKNEGESILSNNSDNKPYLDFFDYTTSKSNDHLYV